MAFTERVIVEIEWNDESKGKDIVGRLLGIEIIKYKDGAGRVYVLDSERKGGEVIRFRGATRLDFRIHRSDVGKVICVRYNGEDKSKEVAPGMNYPKDFSVGVDEDSVDPQAITDLDVPF
jgi:hypothetical protein